MFIGVKRRFYMPEMPKWLIVLIIVVAGWWVITQTIEFVGKVGTTVDKANSSMTNSQNNLKSIGKYD